MIMNCPVCKADLLRQTTLASDLPAYECKNCHGVWLSSNEYLAWLKTHGPTLPEKPGDDSTIPTWDTQELKLCAECGRILSRFRILPNLKFYLDRCGHCNGVWFDKGEWDILVARNLQDKVNQFFTKPWQMRVREEETKSMLDRLYMEKFGAEDYARIKDVWAWLQDHPQRAMLLAYLQAENPYKT